MDKEMNVKDYLIDEYQRYFEKEKDEVVKNHLLGVLNGCWVSNTIPTKEVYTYLVGEAMNSELNNVIDELDKIFKIQVDVDYYEILKTLESNSFPSGVSIDTLTSIKQVKDEFCRCWEDILKNEEKVQTSYLLSIKGKEQLAKSIHIQRLGVICKYQIASYNFTQILTLIALMGTILLNAFGKLFGSYEWVAIVIFIGFALYSMTSSRKLIDKHKKYNIISIALKEIEDNNWE